MKTVLVCGAGGFIGAHLVRRLKAEGAWVRGTDLKLPEFSASTADEFRLGDLRDPHFVREVCDRRFDEVYQLAADMGGAGFIFTGENDADILHNSATINLNVLDAVKNQGAGRVFYSSSACIYPRHNQLDPSNPNCAEDSAYPADPDSEYGWEKLFSERLYLSYARCYGVPVHVARYHNIFGPEGVYDGGREKAPAALCRKVAQAESVRYHRNLGRCGEQTRSFLYRRVPRSEHVQAGAARTRAGPGQYRLGGDGHHQSAGADDRRHRRQAETCPCAMFEGPLGVRGTQIPTTC